VATANIFDLTDAWNAGATTFTAVKMNVTDTASATASMLIDLQHNSTSLFHVLKNGAIHSKRSNYNITNANAAAILVSNYSLTGSSDDSMFDLAGTWNTAGTPTAIKLNITDTASAAGGLLIDLQVGGASQFKVTKAGVITGTLTNATGLPIAGLVSSTSTALGVGTLELGDAADTTLARVSAGVVSIESKRVYTTAGLVDLAETQAVDSIGTRGVVQNSQSADYTLVIGDAGKHILHPSADTTARTFTIPANGTVAFAVGTVVSFVNQASAGVITIAITTDTMRLAGAGTTGSRTLAANGIATAIKLTSTEWIISGTGLT
jgi:hypothetical protein